MPKFSRTNKKRQALKNGLARSLILNGRITTTKSQAKVTSQLVDKLITKGKVNSLSTIRTLSAVVGKDSAKKLISEISPALMDRKGGYTRVLNLPPRKSDAAPVAIVEIIK